MDDFYIHVYKDKINEMCIGCKHCDEATYNIVNADGHYHGYDGCVGCRIADTVDVEDARMFISPLWKKCDKHFVPLEREDYINHFAEHLIYALSECPENTKADNNTDCFFNVLSIYQETLKMYPPVKAVVYSDETKEFFEYWVKCYKDVDNPDVYQKTMSEYYQAFYDKFYK